MRFRTIVATLAWLAASSLALPARAQDDSCSPREIEFFPAGGARDVPRNGVVRVVYREPPDDLPDREDDAVWLFQGASVECPVEDLLRVAGDTTIQNDATGEGLEAVFRSGNLLDPDTQYRIDAYDPILDHRCVDFTTGSLEVDDRPPEFHGADEVHIVETTGDLPADCGAADDYEVSVTFRAAEDEGGAVNVEYLVYQTNGPDWEEPVERKRVRGFGSTDQLAAFVVPRDEIGERACFQVRAVDMFGQAEENDVEVCGTPEGPGLFHSICTVAGGGQGRVADAWPLGVVLLAALRARRGTARRASWRASGVSRSRTAAGRR